MVESVNAVAGSVVDAPDYRIPVENTTAPSSELGKDAFLKLLVAQLKYQDPLEPTSSSEFIATTAQFTMVEKLDELTKQGANSMLVTSLTTASSLVGREVTANRGDEPITAVVKRSRIVSGEVMLDTDKGTLSMADILSIGSPSAPTVTVDQVPPTVPPVTKPAVTEPAAAEPGSTEPGSSEPGLTAIEASEAVTEPGLTEPNAIEPNAIEPNAIEPNLIEPNAIEPNLIEPSAIEPSGATVTEPVLPTIDEAVGLAGTQDEPESRTADQFEPSAPDSEVGQTDQPAPDSVPAVGDVAQATGPEPIVPGGTDTDELLDLPPATVPTPIAASDTDAQPDPDTAQLPPEPATSGDQGAPIEPTVSAAAVDPTPAAGGPETIGPPLDTAIAEPSGAVDEPFDPFDTL